MKNSVTNYAVGIYVVAIIMFLIIPLPAWALDILIAVNMIKTNANKISNI